MHRQQHRVSLTIAATCALTVFALAPLAAEAACDAPPGSCLCEELDGDLGGRAEIVDIDLPAQTVSLRSLGGVRPDGESFGGTYIGGLPCGGAPEVPFEVGDEVYVFFTPASVTYSDCAAYQECTVVECDPLMPDNDPGQTDPGWARWDECDGQCVTSTDDACDAEREARAEERWQVGTVRMTRWDAEELYLGEQLEESIVIPAEDLALRNSPADCLRAYPTPEPPPCNDTGGGQSCSTGGTRPGAWFTGLLMLLVIRRRQ